MKIKLISDTHVNCHADLGNSFWNSIPNDDHDVLVIAGDVCEAQDVDLFDDTWFTISNRFKKVFYTVGNHEYWGGNPWSTDMLIDEILEQYPNVMRLKTGEFHNINGHRFTGSTMWFKDTGNPYNQNKFSDFQNIKNLKEYAFKENAAFIELFNSGSIRKDDIIITHHVPSNALVHQMYKGFPENQFFVCEMLPLALKIKPKLWMYGHTHVQSNIKFGNTLFVSNPFGYPKEWSNAKFNENLVLTVNQERSNV